MSNSFFGPRDRLHFAFLATMLVVAGLASGCRSLLPSDKNHPLEFAYVGPSSATLRLDLAARSDTVTTVKHGERLEIIDTRRRLVRVKAADGAQGWIDANLLLTAGQMQELQRISNLASSLPSQGRANVSDALNAHTEPYRQAPSLFQVAENGKVEVLAHRIASRAPRGSQVAAALQPKPVPGPAAKGPLTKGAKRMSGEREDAPSPQPAASPSPDKEPPAPPVYEDWSLVRGEDGQAGWALSRMLYMEIPDEVIRYTGGNRVTAYLDLGEVDDEGRGKHNWVWTTTSGRGKPFDFDGFRVLIWNPVKHRYETALSEHDLDGHYPLRTSDQRTIIRPEALPPSTASAPTAEPAAATPGGDTAIPDQNRPAAAKRDPGKSKYDPGKGRRFSLVIKDSHDGRTYLRNYELLGRRVKLLSKAVIATSVERLDKATDELAAPQSSALNTAVKEYDPLAPPPLQKGWWERTSASMKGWLAAWTK